MSRKARHNAKIRSRIVVAAAEAFRRYGFGGTNIDGLMAAAGLTRGAFYAHFASKDALLAAAIREEDLLLRLLRGRSDSAPGALAEGMAYIIRALLDPARQETVLRGWGLPQLMREAALGPGSAREAYSAVLAEIRSEMVRGTGCGADDAALASILVQTCGAVAMAAACESEEDRARLLLGAGEAVSGSLARIHGGESSAEGSPAGSDVGMG